MKDATDPQVVVADDWTRNWQARIAVKITAMFLWIIILLSFSALIFQFKGLDARIVDTLSMEADALAHQLQETLATESGSDLSFLLQRATGELAKYSFDGLELQIGPEIYQIGNAGPGYDSQLRDLGQLPAGSGYNGKAFLIAHHAPIKDLVSTQRNTILIYLALGIFAFGLFLTWTIHNVLAKPFKLLIDATQGVSAGNLDLRIDVSRQDEFGHLAQFFNQMLDRLCVQQHQLKQSNEDLTKEISVRKEAEAELRANRDKLEQLVHKRTADLAVARDDALKASHAKSAFIANISHEIRTPLTPIIGFAESMLDGNQNELERRESLESIIRNGKHLLSIINDILDLSKIEADKLDIESLSFSPHLLLKDVDAMAGMLAREKGLGFEIIYSTPIPDRITSDPTRLRQILINLCANAVKFTSKGQIRIEVSCQPERELIQFAVIDSGIGIGHDKQNRLFRAFSQADSSTTREYGGTGLGLYISGRLARMLGGGIEVSSALGVGSRFTVTIATTSVSDVSFRDQYSMDSAPLPDNSDTIKCPCLDGSILLAEDSDDNQRLVSMYVRRCGGAITVVANGKLAVEAALEKDFDLILMDMQMPVMGGKEAVTLLRNAGYEGAIIALSANAMTMDQMEYKKIGCDGFLSKPIDRQLFYMTLSQFLRPNQSGSGGDSAETYAERDHEFELLIARFLEDLPASIDNLEQSHARRDWIEVRQAAHRLKGMGGGFGFPEITDLAGKLERLIRQNYHDEAGTALAELLICLRSTVADSVENATTAGSVA